VLRDDAKAPPQHEGLLARGDQISTTCPGLSAAKRSRGNLRFIERPMQRVTGAVDCLVGQLKRAVMMRQRLLCAAIGQRL